MAKDVLRIPAYPHCINVACDKVRLHLRRLLSLAVVHKVGIRPFRHVSRSDSGPRPCGRLALPDLSVATRVEFGTYLGIRVMLSGNGIRMLRSGGDKAGVA